MQVFASPGNPKLTAPHLLREYFSTQRAKPFFSFGRADSPAVTLISAPAGYGKTQFLTQWRGSVSSKSARVVWIDASSQVNIPADVAELLDWPVHSGKMVPGGSPSKDGRIKWGLGGDHDTILMIDDYHLIANQSIDRYLRILALRAVRGLHIVIASRHEVRLPLGLLELKGCVLRLTADDLRLSEDDIAKVFNGALVAAEVSALWMQTEGWPAAVGHAFKWWSAQTDQSVAPSGELDDIWRPFDVFVLGEVLSCLNDTEIEFLVETSLLETLTPDLADAVRGSRESWRALEALCAKAIVGRTSTGTGFVYRCNPLIRRALKRQLNKRGERALGQLSRRAAIYLSRHGDTLLALKCAGPSGDVDLLVELFNGAGAIAIGVRDGYFPLQALLRELPAGCFSHPRVRVAETLSYIRVGRVGLACNLLKQIRFDQPDDHTRDPLVERDIWIAELLLIAYGQTGFGQDEITNIDRAALGDIGDRDLTSGLYYHLACAAALDRPHISEALAHAESAIYFYEKSGSDNGLARMQLQLGRIELARADPIRAARHLEEGRRLFVDRQQPDIGGAALANVFLAEALLDLGETAKADMMSGQSLAEIASGERYWEALYSAYRTMVAAAIEARDEKRAYASLASGMAYATENGSERLRALLNLEMIRLSLKGSFSAEPMPTLQGFAADCQASHWIENDLKASCAATYHLKRGDPGRSREYLDELLERQTNAGLSRAAIDSLLDRALLDEVTPISARTFRDISAALKLAAPAGVLLPFVQRSSRLLPIIRMLDKIVGPKWDSSEIASFRKIVLKRMSQDVGECNLLSSREQQVLVLLVELRSNKDIARSLGVSPETVRFHLKSIYTKFGISIGYRNRKTVVSVVRQRNAEGLDIPGAEVTHLRSTPEAHGRG